MRCQTQVESALLLGGMMANTPEGDQVGENSLYVWESSFPARMGMGAGHRAGSSLMLSRRVWPLL